MDGKFRKGILFLAVYVVIFIIGFRAGEIYNRMKRGYAPEKVVVPISDVFYVVEDRDYGTYHYTDFREVASSDPVIQFLSNEKLRPLLKLKKLEIYKSDGEKVY